MQNGDAWQTNIPVSQEIRKAKRHKISQFNQNCIEFDPTNLSKFRRSNK